MARSPSAASSRPCTSPLHLGGISPASPVHLPRYFFYIFLMIVTFGIINGIFFAPAILGLLGGDKAAPAGGGHSTALRAVLEARLGKGAAPKFDGVTMTKSAAGDVSASSEPI